MDKSLANLLLENGEATLPLLVLIAISTKRGKIMRIKYEDISRECKWLKLDSDFRDLERSGLIKVDEKNEVIELGDGVRYFYQPPERTKKEKAPPTEKEIYTHPLLETLAEATGYPIDWISGRGKYMKLLSALKRREKEPTILEVATYIKKEEVDVTLQYLMSKKGFEMYLKLSKNQERAPKVDKHSDRVKRADYSGDQPF